MTHSELTKMVRKVLKEYLSEDNELPSSEEPIQPEEPTPPAAPPIEPEGTITLDKAKELISGTKGGFFTVTFLAQDKDEKGRPKKNLDGTLQYRLRTMNARLGVKKHLRGGELPYDPRSKGLIPVFDMQKREYRMVNSNTIQSLNIGKKQYTVIPNEPPAEAPEENAPVAVNEIRRMQKLANILHD
jgi:hypothetical protein